LIRHDLRIEAEECLMVRDLGQFLQAVWRGWLSRLSGILGGVAWAIGAVYEPMPVVLRWTILAFGPIAILIAAFSVWRDEYRRRSEIESDYRDDESSKASVRQIAALIHQGRQFQKAFPRLDSENAGELFGICDAWRTEVRELAKSHGVQCKQLPLDDLIPDSSKSQIDYDIELLQIVLRTL
jgi:hypothetical protein